MRYRANPNHYKKAADRATVTTQKQRLVIEDRQYKFPEAHYVSNPINKHELCSMLEANILSIIESRYKQARQVHDDARAITQNFYPDTYEKCEKDWEELHGVMNDQLNEIVRTVDSVLVDYIVKYDIKG